MAATDDSPTHASAHRRHVGLTMPRRIKQEMVESAQLLGWSVGQWALTAAAEHGSKVQRLLAGAELARRPRVDDATFTAIYLTDEERAEIDDQATDLGMNRSAFLTAVAAIALGGDPREVLRGMGLSLADPTETRGGPERVAQDPERKSPPSVS